MFDMDRNSEDHSSRGPSGVDAQSTDRAKETCAGIFGVSIGILVQSNVSTVSSGSALRVA
jgi:hypothetical protein